MHSSPVADEGESSAALAFPGLPRAWTVEGTVERIWDDFDPAWYTGALGETNGVGVKARQDGGPAWVLRGTPGSTLFHETSDLDPWFGKAKLRADYAGSGNISRMIDHPFGPLVGSLAGVDSLIWQWAWKFVGTGGKGFLGKNIDLGTGNNPGGVVHRITAESWSDGRVGLATPADCNTDTRVCNVIYADNGATPRFPEEGPPGTATTFCDVAFSNRNDTVGEEAGGWWFKTTRNFTVDPPGTNAANYLDEAWRLDTMRWTRSAETGSEHGRVEMWRTQVNGTTTKIMEYLGDVGQRFEGSVNVWPSNANFTMHTANGPFGFTQAQWDSSSLMVHLGGYCVAGHARLAL